MNTLRLLLLSLYAYLALGAVDGEGDPPDAGDGGAPDDDIDQGTLEDFLEVVPASDAAPQDESPEGKLTAAEKRAQRAEQELEFERRSRSTQQPAAPQQYVDPQWAREDEEYRQAHAAGWSADQLANKRWQIESNRSLRANQMASMGALAQAQDLRDRTAFEKIEKKNPAVFKRYEQRVEQHLANVRASGSNAPREAILSYLVGQDLLTGAVKPRSARAAPSNTVDRGRSPGTRSDVTPKGRLSERQKRAQRLDGVII